MVPQSWLSDSAENHYIIPNTLPQEITRANIERSINYLCEGMDTQGAILQGLSLCRSSKI